MRTSVNRLQKEKALAPIARSRARFSYDDLCCYLVKIASAYCSLAATPASDWRKYPSS